MVKNLPSELITEILSRLPVKSLLRFRRVSKFFRSTIDGKDFAKYHLNRSLTTNTNHTLLVTERESPHFHGSGSIISYDFDSLDNPWVFYDPLNACCDSLFLEGLCHGLLCLRWFEQDSDPTNTVTIVNIATRKYRILPAPEGFDRTASYCLAFGYDASNDDYKVINLTNYNDDDNSQLMVYSMQENAWRKVNNTSPYYLYVSDVIGSSPFVSGKIHYMVETSQEFMIVAFDLSTEEFNEVELPDCLHCCNIVDPYLTLLDDCLCVVSYCDGTRFENIWMMKEYGVLESWTEVFSFRLDIDQRESRELQPEPVEYSWDKEKVLVTKIADTLSGYDRLAWYNLKTKKMKNVGRLKKRLPREFSADVTVTSLVSVAF